MLINYQHGFADLNGAQIYYETAGAGHPLVLLHAGICDLRMWDEQFVEFSQTYRVLRFDMRGFGRTPPVAGAFAFHTDLHALLHELRIAKTYLLGCSFGGSTCLDFTLAYPDMVEALILVGSSPSGYRATAPHSPLLEAVNTAMDAGDYDCAAELEVQIWVDGPSRTPDQVSASIRQRVHAMNRIALQNEALELGDPQPLDPSATERLHDVQAPTLLITGNLDQPRIVEAVAWMAARLPHAYQAVIPGTAHLPNLEEPARFNRIVLDFLAQSEQD
ncbi:MAG: alpha/beta hydrolase [Caldilineaceae bacterium]